MSGRDKLKRESDSQGFSEENPIPPMAIMAEFILEIGHEVRDHTAEQLFSKAVLR